MTIHDLYMHEVHNWKKTIGFYEEELVIFEERLAEVAQKNNKQPAMDNIGHFKNRFIVQKQSLQTLQHDVYTQQQTITTDVNKDGKMLNMHMVDIQFLLRDRIHMYEKMMMELKQGFYRFLARIF